ncbi:MAG: hypothetical protein ACKVUS_20155 [Saprospiraceae bacterium]
MKKTSNAHPYFMAHPFWDSLRIHPQSKTFEVLKKLDPTTRRALVSEAVKGFYPVSYASLLAFKRFADLAENPESKAIAHEIYLVEKGEKPLIEGSDMTGVLHCNQMKMMFESLLGEALDIAEPEEFEVLKKADISNSSIVKSMAICDLIENTAPFVIHFYQDFLIQCQLAMGVPSECLNRNYLDEHNLTEGDSCEDQHIEMLGKMKGNYQELEKSAAYRQEKEEFIALVSVHFEQHRQNMAAIIGTALAA